MNSPLPAAVPEIPVTDLADAISYYQHSLGFTLDWGGGDLGLAGISSGNCRLFLADAKYRTASGNPGPVTIWLNLESRAQVDDLHREWTSTGAQLGSAPESKPWGLHEFEAADRDGNRIRVFYDFATAARTSSRSRPVSD